MLLLFYSIFISLFAPGPKQVILFRVEPINPYSDLILAVVQVESSGDVWAINITEQAVGPFQIRGCRIEDYNNLNGTDYKLWDCFDYDIAKKVFNYYCQDRDFETVARSWNGSGKKTVDYWNKVKRYL